MNKMLITIAAAALLISGCGDKDDAASGMTEPSAVEKTMESASDAMESATDMASDAADAASDAADDATEMAAGAMDEASDMASDATEAAGEMADGGVVGQQVYMKSCVACHAAGIAGAPKLGDKAAWAPRIATGMDALVTSSIKGKNVMPPRGTCASCSDDDLKAAVEYMVSQAQ